MPARGALIDNVNPQPYCKLPHRVVYLTTPEDDRKHSRRASRLMQFLTRKGFLIEEQGMRFLADTDPDLALAPLRAAACTYRIALGLRAAQKC